MVVQVIGLPCSGKTTAIKEFTKRLPIRHIDIRNYDEEGFINEIKLLLEKGQHVIAESATGYNIRNTKIIKLSVSSEQIYSRSLTRDQTFDEDYLSLLESVMIKTKYTASNKMGLVALLNNFFKS